MRNTILKKVIVVMLVISIILATFSMFFNMSYAATYNQTIINANSNNNHGIDAFPESYQVLLKKLVEKTGHTNWNFKPFYTDIDWTELTSTKNENSCRRNTVYKDNEASWYCSAIHDANNGSDGYYCASGKLVNYFLDPRNFLTEITIFQFLNLAYDEKTNTITNIEKAVSGSFMDGNAQNGERYSQIIYDAAIASGENALSIVSRIFQELGKGKPGTPPSMVSGTDSTYPNTYNFFNYGATDGTGAKIRGLAYASKEGWNDPRTALVQGAKLVAETYTNVGQNTKYTVKFDVAGNEYNQLYTHQYMTNVQDPTNQSKILYDYYQSCNLLNEDLTFIIPVYKNMPTYVKLPSTLTNGDLYYVSPNYSNVALRSGAGSTYPSLGSQKKDTLVIMIEKNSAYNNGYWHKIQLENGTIGYMSDEYLTSVNTIKDIYSVPSQPPNESNGGTATEFRIEEDRIIVEPDTTISSIKADGVNITSAIKDGKPLGDNDKIGTGTVITIDGTTSYTVVKLGDVSGDGYVDARDSVRVLRYSIGQYSLENEYWAAGNLLKNGEIDARSAVRILKCDIGQFKITL